jgi:hypothetical protein
VNKFFSIIALSAVISLGGGCDDAVAATESKLSVNAVVDAGFDKLPADQQAQIIQTVAAAQTKGSTNSMADVVDKWVNVGERLGKVMGGAAKEIGVAANDFAKTDLGRMTAMLVVWNYMGKDIIDVVVHVGGGLLILVVGLSWIYIIMRRSQEVTTTYSDTVKNVFGNYVIVHKERVGLSSDQQVGFLFAAAVIIVVGVIMMISTL